MEEIENGKSVNGKSTYVNWVSGGGWMQRSNNSQNNPQHLGSGQNNQNAGVLQGQPQRNGSRAFWNVLENLFRKHEERIKNSKSHSLKEKDAQYLELAKNPERNEAKLREMVDEA